jgi:transcriptional regulator with XRE-family HTH domain
MARLESRYAAIFGANFRRAREALGLSQRRAAARIGIHQATLSDVETGGANLTLRSIVRLSEAVDLPLPTMLTDPEPGGSR